MLKSNNKNLKNGGSGPGKFIFKILFLSGLVLSGIFTSQNARAATSFFSPSSGNFTVGNIFTVNVLINTEGAAVNNAEAVINFPSDLLEIVSISKSGSIFSLWVEEPVFSNSAGSLSFNGGLPTPGFNGAAGKTLGVVFRAKKVGSASLVFSSAAIRANDGFGTNVFKAGSQAIFNLISEEKPAPVSEEELPPAPTAGGTPEAPTLYSSTHPDENKWYANNDPEISWKLPAGVNGLSIYLSQSPTSNPGPASDGFFDSKSYENAEDGTWYFHIKFRNQYGWGQTTHRKILIDTKAPAPFEIKVQAETLADSRPVLNFETTDALSGMDNYEIIVDQGSITKTAENEYKLPVQTLDKHTIIVKASDKAGNYTLAMAELDISAAVAPEITEYPRQLAIGETLNLAGKMIYPNSEVIIWLQKDDGEPRKNISRSNEAGRFVFSEKEMQEGVYRLWVEVMDKEGKQSSRSEKVTITVKRTISQGLSDWLFRFGSWAVKFLTILIPLIAMLLLLLLLLWYSWRKFVKLKLKAAREIREIKRTLKREFERSKKDTQKLIEVLEGIRQGRRFIEEEEEKIIEQCKKNLESVDKYLKRDTDDKDETPE